MLNIMGKKFKIIAIAMLLQQQIEYKLFVCWQACQRCNKILCSCYFHLHVH